LKIQVQKCKEQEAKEKKTKNDKLELSLRIISLFFWELQTKLLLLITR